MKKRYIFLIIILIIIISIIGVAIALSKTKQKNEEIKREEEDRKEFKEQTLVFSGGTIVEAREDDYYIINENVTTFLNSLAFDDAEFVYRLLDKKYIEDNGITEENVLEKLKFSDKYQEFQTNELYYIEINENYVVYLAYGSIMEKNSEDGIKKHLDVQVNVDLINSTFSVIPYAAGTLDKNSIDINKINEENTQIESNEYNQFARFSTGERMQVVELFDTFKNETLYYTDSSYQQLDEEYKNKRFESIEKYKEYVNANRTFFENLLAESYSVTSKDGYTEYRIMDNYGNIYVFDVTSVLNYTAKLDEYTIPTEEFIAAYNKASDSEKVGMNIEKFFQMINAKDYNSAYNCFTEGFKQNYFPTIEDFKKYAQENFFTSNSLEGVEVKNEGETYMYTVNIKDYKQRDERTITKTFIMQLGQGTDFVISFNVE